MTQLKQHKVWLGIVVAIVVFVVMVPELLNDKKSKHKGYPGLGGDFTLQSINGPVSLKDYRGKVVVLYFGYTYCPDICPTSLGMLSLAFNKMTPKELDNLQAFFISVDPERDTVQRLRDYTNSFHAKIMGLTDSPDVIAELASRYKVMYQKVDLPGSALGYSVDHSSRYYVIGRDGVLQKMIMHGTEVDKIVADLRAVLSQ